MPRPFLKARWTNLCILSYSVDAAALSSMVPPGLELDRPDGSGGATHGCSRAWLSLVAFDFQNTRVGGISWPGCVSFPEVNLRFYVREGGRRGVCFIREFVPRRAVSWIARTVYNEPYRTIDMTSRVRGGDLGSKSVEVLHQFTAGGRVNTIHMRGTSPMRTPEPSSVEHWFKEHECGYGVSRRGRLLRYRIVHPTWDLYTPEVERLDVHLPAVYGEHFRELHGRPPEHVMLAVGSDVEVHPLESDVRS
ncbi:MAG: DUF2071 domain-containing protein [Phycisphaerae bacterium]|nr:DUF2071 domain-containing protein [Phycisphaerae bacterium]